MNLSDHNPRETRACRGPRAFTLIEMMITVAIIVVLLGILVPAIGKARNQAKRASCTSNLKQVGVAFATYLGKFKDRLPYASYMPSVSPAPLQREEPIYIADVLTEHLGRHAEDVFRCPADLTDAPRPAPNFGLSYFESERSSYEYRTQLAGQTMDEITGMIKNRSRRIVAPNMIWALRDYDNFHGEAGTPGARRYLYADGHVADYEN